jgi:hypothetical protein
MSESESESESRQIRKPSFAAQWIEARVLFSLGEACIDYHEEVGKI